MYLKYEERIWNMTKNFSQFFDNCYDVYEQIGSGQFAVVRRCIEKSTGHEYAAKFLRKQRVVGSRRGAPIADIVREVDILKSSFHPNIVFLKDVFENDEEVILVLELVRGGELYSFLLEKDKLDEEAASIFMREILLGVYHLHSQSIAHLDLKPENILLVRKHKYNVKLIDFGLSQRIPHGSDIRSMRGTPEFLAPEIVNYEPLSVATDMWSIGVITYMMISGASPFLGESHQETFWNITALNYDFDEEYFGTSSDLVKDFISRLLVSNPRKRFTAEQCLNHPWIQCLNLPTIPVLPSKVLCHLYANPAQLYKKRWKHVLDVVVLLTKLSKGLERNSSSAETYTETTHSYQQDGNFVIEALFTAVEEGNLGGLEELFSISHIDANHCNKHGETALHIAAGLGQLDIVKFLHSRNADIHAVDSHGDSAIYWAARQGHEQIIKYLYEKAASVDTQNKAKETALHVASRYGHTNAVALLCRCCTDVNLPDEHGETALHIAVWHGFPRIVDTLCNFGAHTNLKNKEDETPLHCAAARGHTDCVRSLLDADVKLDLVDKTESTALHLAMKRHHEAVSFLLLQSGCQTDIYDNHGEGPIHIACREGLLSLVKALCASKTKVNVPNKLGFFPVHLAAKNGHIEIIRTLCLAGCVVDQKNREGIPAEITALAHGFTDISELLNKLKNDQQREEYINQLAPSTVPINRVKVKIFGHSGVGKTSLLDSLKCGYFSSWFRRSKSNSSSSVGNGTSKLKNGNHSSKTSIEFELGGTDEPSLSFETNYESYTHGIDIHQINISGVGDLSIWEFSGHEPYYVVYDHFIGNTYCLHSVLFSLSDSFDVQLQQVMFWLSFLQARIPPHEPLGHCGKSNKAAKVILIATHADLANCPRNNNTNEYMSTEAEAVLEAAQLRFKHIFDIHDTVYVLDAHVVGSQTMKALKQHMTNVRAQTVQDLPKQNGFLDSTLTHLLKWRTNVTNFPVISWQQFIDTVHAQVNPLAGMDHLKEVIYQLQLMGELLYLKLENQDLVVLNPRWLCVDIIGHLLSQEHVDTAKITGLYTVEDIQQLFPDTDALDLLQVLESLHLCTQCDSDGEIEYEFPCFNMLDSQDCVWEKNDLRYANGVYGGVRIQSWPADKHLLRCMIPRLQVQLRRYAHDHPNRENSLYQWRLGSSFICSTIQGQITLGEFGESIDIKVRAPSFLCTEGFYFLESLLGVVDQTILETCPGLLYEKHAISPTHLSQHAINPVSYPSHTLLTALFDHGTDCTAKANDGSTEEQIVDVICLGSTEVLQQSLPPGPKSPGTSGIILGPNLHASQLPLPVHQRLCALLDPPEPIGRDWCMLAVLLGLTDMLPHLDPGDNPARSPTARILHEWLKDNSSTIGCLLTKLRELSRHDAVETILHTAPFLKVFSASDEMSSEDSGICSMSHTSSSNISR